jgi:hypothetical protein
MFQNESYPQLPKGDEDLGIYQTIKHSKIHKIATHTIVFPCVEAGSWII